MKITKYQRHPTDASGVIIHYLINQRQGTQTATVLDQVCRDALEAAGKLED